MQSSHSTAHEPRCLLLPILHPPSALLSERVWVKIEQEMMKVVSTMPCSFSHDCSPSVILVVPTSPSLQQMHSSNVSCGCTLESPQYFENKEYRRRRTTTAPFSFTFDMVHVVAHLQVSLEVFVVDRRSWNCPPAVCLTCMALHTLHLSVPGSSSRRRKQALASLTLKPWPLAATAQVGFALPSADGLCSSLSVARKKITGKKSGCGGGGGRYEDQVAGRARGVVELRGRVWKEA